MIARAGSGWQTVLADLSLILFMVMAAAVNEAPASAPAAPPPPVVLPALGDPVALWRQAPDAPSLKDWLASSGPDPRLRLTILAAPDAANEALALAVGAGRPARVLIEPGATGISAALTYDQALAQPLQQVAAKETTP
jgi:hypothetical protein